MIIYCEKCGAQNFVGEERLKVANLSPPLCWACFEKLPLQRETDNGKDESNNCSVKNLLER